MRMLLMVREPRLPMQDEEIASRMIQLFERRPRPNSRLRIRRAECVELAGGLVGALIAAVLVGLLFTF